MASRGTAAAATTAIRQLRFQPGDLPAQRAHLALASRQLGFEQGNRAAGFAAHGFQPQLHGGERGIGVAQRRGGEHERAGTGAERFAGRGGRAR
jgi:hypothetical protein